MSALFMFAVIVLAVVAMVIAISKFKQHPFIVLVVVAVVVGLVCGIPTDLFFLSSPLRRREYCRR